MKFEARINPKARTIYVPKAIVENLESTEVLMVPDRKAVFVYPCNASTEEALHSLEVIHKELSGPAGKEVKQSR